VDPRPTPFEEQSCSLFGTGHERFFVLVEYEHRHLAAPFLPLRVLWRFLSKISPRPCWKGSIATSAPSTPQPTSNACPREPRAGEAPLGLRLTNVAFARAGHRGLFHKPPALAVGSMTWSERCDEPGFSQQTRWRRLDRPVSGSAGLACCPTSVVAPAATKRSR
jgi:hypothetical protein